MRREQVGMHGVDAGFQDNFEGRRRRSRRGFALASLLCTAVALWGCGVRPDAPPVGMTPATSGSGVDASGTRQEIGDLVDQGDFARAGELIEAALVDAALPQGLRADLEFERERMRRIRMDFGLSRADALERVRRVAPQMSEARFDAFDADGLLESMNIDGQRWYFNRAPWNLFRISAEARALRPDPDAPFSSGPYEQLHPHHAEVLEATRAAGVRFLPPIRVRITQSLRVAADAVPAGETVRAWIPYPREIPGQQQDLVFLASEPATHHIAAADRLQRTVYLEKPARAGEPTGFSIQYELDIAAQHVDIDPDRVVPTPPDPGLQPYLVEDPPHVVYTDALRLFSAEAVGDETNPYRIAQRLFAAVDRIPWAGAREYSTIRNISDYALHAGHADCGQQTLLLIALLRLNGIPARWQSGWMFSRPEEGHANLHDWGQVFLAPYGWVPVDVTTGLLDSADPGLRWFYLGGLDAYRIAFNDGISTPFDPPKQFFRSETVDSQRGEAEWRGGNLYFDQWDYGFEAVVLPSDVAPSNPGEHP